MSATGSERVTRTRAGPSKSTSKPKRKQTTGKEPVEEEESDDFTPMVQADSAEDDEITEVGPPRTRKPAARPVNGTSVAKGKGKTKADSAPNKKLLAQDDIEIVDDDDDVGPQGTARAINDATATNKATKRAENSNAASKDNERLRRQLASAQANIDDLKKQLEESYRVRHTEPEELHRSQVEKYEEIIRTKDLLLKQQEEMLSRKEPLSKDGKGSVLHMVTREHADAEKRSAEEQVTYWKSQADTRERLVQQKETEIAALKQTESDLQYEIKTERELSQKASQKPPSAQRARGPHVMLGSDDPKHSQLVRFYEDTTNLLVTDIKIQEPKYFDLEEWSVTCIYTYIDKNDENNNRSLGFLLRFTWDPINATAPVETKDDLERAIQYAPLHLDKESHEFIEALGFMNKGFTFPRKQLPIFYSSLVESMTTACAESDDDSMQDVELVE
ncbi:hypothetical protein DFH07DRAFT_854920 [Mycena maculata]|uniref:Monopolin complex subunit Csm1/Pcs1 C-terminal domain-containing protein n=1 Tax=Mycena maculata TaxID=230809 RepID=A0AAD7MN52_9AGAR|nr:hypothetical protein DFH07DRAFT_854920 [Mycena maculata]